LVYLTFRLSSYHEGQDCYLFLDYWSELRTVLEIRNLWKLCKLISITRVTFLTTVSVV
jgi:hypothetical protein